MKSSYLFKTMTLESFGTFLESRNESASALVFTEMESYSIYRRLIPKYAGDYGGKS